MFQQLWKEMNQGKIDPVYVLSGTETYFIDETIRRMKQALEQAG